MTLLVTERLRLRELDEHDAAFVLELVNEPAWKRFIGDRGITALEGAQEYIRTVRESTQRHGFGLWAVEQSSDSTPVGICGLLRRDTLDDVDIGFAVLARYCGQGYAQESARAVLDHGHGPLGLARIVAITHPDNAASIRVLERIGLSRAGKTRLAEGGPELELYTSRPFH